MTMPTTEEIVLHGRRLTLDRAGTGPVVLLIHGLAHTKDTWAPVMAELSTRCQAVAADLPGYGDSDPPPGDYSLGAYACVLRDLLDALGHRSATLVGHSLGGGIAMQFAYQFPERCDRLVLVATGGLGPDVSPVLRAAALPGSESILAFIAHRRLVELGRITGRQLRMAGIRLRPSMIEAARGYGALAEPGIRRTFVQSLRAVVDHRGQRISTEGRLHIIDRIPTMLVWGGNDQIIPVDHAHRSHREMPGSRLEIFEHAGHFPHADEPRRFVKALHSFLAAPGRDAASCHPPTPEPASSHRRRQTAAP